MSNLSLSELTYEQGLKVWLGNNALPGGLGFTTLDKVDIHSVGEFEIYDWVNAYADTGDRFLNKHVSNIWIYRFGEEYTIDGVNYRQEDGTVDFNSSFDASNYNQGQGENSSTSHHVTNNNTATEPEDGCPPEFPIWDPVLGCIAEGTGNNDNLFEDL